MENIILSPISLEDLKTVISQAVKVAFDNLAQPQPDPTSEYITRKETAKFLGISLPTLNEWSKTGVIISYRIGTRVRYNKAEVENSLTKVKSLKYNRGV